MIGAGAVASLGDHIFESGTADVTSADVEALDIPVMLAITDSSAGELEILVGEQAISFTDRQLVSRLLRAARQESI